ncbi:Fur family transcriptional regulator [Alteribacillus bidgolensis]|uniref:Fur family transcriptional regulator, zinc uptake regulator n=1 Tax=Alteribacillus bidgolensis TaxID=930129 RepID=A0A1G8CZE2_9BACI|nr:Fur family transcriptional regulator [Alteribacillus bidgolensis]SDH50300.1 Fur family transcriptional regulator, zinc uptake regulator [Alteribacillus bidgolensis]
MNIAAALDILREKGYKFTGKRAKMLEIFVEENRYLSAKNAFQFMRDDYPNLSVDTIYRNIKLFEKLDILESTEIKGETRYRYKCSKDHHHQIICTDCGTVQKIEMCPMEAVSTTPEGFTITHHKFEIYGYCEDCKP